MDAAYSYADQIRILLDGFKPDTAIVLGSGLGRLAEKITNARTIKYTEIKNFPQTGVSGHVGALIAGQLGEKNVICLQGRFHLYEGHSPQTVASVIRTLKLLGVKTLIVTNAAGSLDPQMPPGSLMLINDHINFSGCNPLCGPNDEAFGPRFPDMSNAYNADYRRLVHTVAKKNNIKLHDGVYFMVLGPNFETSAEIKAFRTLGADAVGMSTVPEVLAAVHCGLKVIGISVITNFGTGLKKEAQSHEETLSQADEAAIRLELLVQKTLEEL